MADNPKPYRVDLILSTVQDLVQALLNDDRRDDEELPRGSIEEALGENELTIGDIVGAFTDALLDALYEEEKR